MMKLRMAVVTLAFSLISGCANLTPIDEVASVVNNLPSTAAGGPSAEQTGGERDQVATDSSDQCSGSRRMSRIRCRW